MLIDFIFPEHLTGPLGLQPAKLRNCGQLVVLAGPNGAGKSRYLKLVPEITKVVPDISGRIRTAKQYIENPFFGPHSEASRAQLEAAVRGLESIAATVRWAGEIPAEIRTIPLRYELANPGFRKSTTGLSATAHSAPPDKVIEQAQQNTSGGFGTAADSVPAYFHEVARTLYESGHPLHKDSKILQQRRQDVQSFNRVLRAFFSAEVEVGMDAQDRPIAHFRGRPFQVSELSEGEQILVIWTILLHRQKEWLRGAQVLIDEPENHLHPDACIRALEALRSDEILGPDGQIWLATHSIPLIAYAGLDSVYLVDHGSMEYVGNRVEKVVNSLMGGEQGRSRLRALLAEADELAFDNFAAQCLIPPLVAEPRKDDPQQAQMAKLTQQLGARKENIRILDYAAGRGRLAVALREAGLAAQRNFTYYAYQAPAYTSSVERRECLERIRQLAQPEPVESYLVDRIDRLSVPGVEPIDLVVMCNVLHEIPVRQWLECFSHVQEVLAEDGYLVILEDQLPSVGELPHANGYVILDDIALMELFASKEAVQHRSIEKDGRLTAFGIPKRFLRNASAATIQKTLEKVRRKAKDELRNLRAAGSGEHSFQHGRRHAHYALLLTNAQLALEEYQMT